MNISRDELLTAGESILMSSGEMVKNLRSLKGLSQMELSELTGISQTNISAIENNRVNLGKERSIALARALNVHPSTIMFSDYEDSVA